jgi:hypothetical protein
LDRVKKLLCNRLSLAIALLAIFAVTLAGSRPTAIASCPDRVTIRYYNNAAHTTQVGYCHHDCCQLLTCTGEQTSYYTVKKVPCDFN